MTIQEEIHSTLPDWCTLGTKIHYFAEIDSTNRLAKTLATQGAAHGTVIVADRQTAGRGRLGRTFHSPNGGMYLSIILRPDLPLSDMMAVTACTASAVFAALQEFGIEPKIKWVNDLFLNERKICGILCEGVFSSDGHMDYLVIGIGLNLKPDANLPRDLRDIVTDIATETGIHIPRNAAVVSILRFLDRYMAEIRERTFLPIYTAHSYTLGKQVIVSRETGNQTGLAVRYTQDAGLVVRFEDGVEEVIQTGTARLANEKG